MSLHRVFLRFFLGFCCGSVSLPIFANIEGDMQDFFNRHGMAANITSPGHFEDQTAGYYSGGGISVRSQPRNTQLMTLQMPTFKAGCGGIDLWAGGLSFINADELRQMLKGITTSALNYAFMLGLQKVSPVLYNTMNELNAMAQKINAMNINSCEMGATLLGGAWPKSDQASQHLCKAMGTESGLFKDWAKAKHECGKDGAQKYLRSEHFGDKYKDMLSGEFNLAWRALQKYKFLTEDPDLAELFMTLTGTLIMREEPDPANPAKKALVPERKLSLADNSDVLRGLIEGGSTPIYRCEDRAETKCLKPVQANTNIPSQLALLAKVKKILGDLSTKIQTDDPITPAEKDFLNACRLPVYKMLNISVAHIGGKSPLNVEQYSELITADIVASYITEVIELVEESIHQLRKIQVKNDEIHEFLHTLRDARGKVAARRISAYQQLDNTLSMIKATQLIERQLNVMLGTVSNEEHWH
jgi:conjugative transfer pilus assembly protein TraH